MKFEDVTIEHALGCIEYTYFDRGQKEMLDEGRWKELSPEVVDKFAFDERARVWHAEIEGLQFLVIVYETGLVEIDDEMVGVAEEGYWK